MEKLFYILILIALTTACKTIKSGYFVEQSTATVNKTTLVILNEHAKNTQLFNQVSIRGTVDYTSNTINQEVGMHIKIEKDKQILVSINFKGFPIAKALITPQKLSYYQNLNSTYYEGDYTALNHIVGKDLTYSQLQNILLGQLTDDPINRNFITSMEDGFHKLSYSTPDQTQSTYYLEGQSALLKKEEITTVNSNQKVTISYPNYQKVANFTIPATINIHAQLEQTTNIHIEYNKVTFNEDNTIKYKIPTSYKRIYL